MAGDGPGFRGDTAPGEIEGLREQRAGTQVDQIPAIGAERTGVLDAGIGLDNLDSRSLPPIGRCARATSRAARSSLV